MKHALKSLTYVRLLAVLKSYICKASGVFGTMVFRDYGKNKVVNFTMSVRRAKVKARCPKWSKCGPGGATSYVRAFLPASSLLHSLEPMGPLHQSCVGPSRPSWVPEGLGRTRAL